MSTPKGKRRRLAVVLAAFILLFSPLALNLAPLASPASAACLPFNEECLEPIPDTRPLHLRVFGYFLRGADYYWQTVLSWIGLDRSRLIDRTPATAGAACDIIADCDPGEACLNVCEDGVSCDVFVKRCLPSAAVTIDVPQAYAPCGGGNLCAEGTLCTRTCPEGAACEVTHRCLPPAEAFGSCAAAAECVAGCAARGFPSAGRLALRAECRAGACACDVVEIDPAQTRVSCPADTRSGTLLCPVSTVSACAASGCPGGDCPPRETCLTDPAYGGSCLRDAHCENVACPPDTHPFCDPDGDACRCRSQASGTLQCAIDADCAAIACEDDEEKVCTPAGCACARTETAVIACQADADCPASCPSNYEPACVNSACACRLTPAGTEGVACATVADCAAVACPAEYEKTCRENLCSCVGQAQ